MKVEMLVSSSEVDVFVTRDPALRGGRPIITGTGLSVRTLVIEANQGFSAEEIAADHPPLSVEQVRAGLAFYQANKQEIDADILSEQRAYDDGVRTSGLPSRS